MNFCDEFLEIIYDSLKMGGKFFLAVPNEFFSFKEGNVGMFLFQHLNYFTPEILQSLLNKNGFNVTGLISSRYKELMVMAQKIPIYRKLSINSATRKGKQILLKDNKIKDDQSRTNIDNEIKKLMESEEKDNVSNNDSAGDSSLEDSIIKILNKN